MVFSCFQPSILNKFFTSIPKISIIRYKSKHLPNSNHVPNLSCSYLFCTFFSFPNITDIFLIQNWWRNRNKHISTNIELALMTKTIFLFRNKEIRIVKISSSIFHFQTKKTYILYLHLKNILCNMFSKKNLSFSKNRYFKFFIFLQNHNILFISHR